MLSPADISPIGFGCDPLGGHNWGAVDAAAIMAAVPRALDLGVTLFDTADCYGNGRSEERLGEALAGRRQEALVASKFGVRIGKDGRTFIDNDPAWIAEAVEASLKRLGTDWIDIYQLHWWDGKTPFAAIFEALERLVAAGRIRAYGVTNVTLEMLGLGSAADLPRHFISASMEFSLVKTSNREAVAALCGNPARRSVFLAWGSLGGGMLSGKYTSAADLSPTDRRLKRPDSHFAGERLARNLEIVALCREIAAAHRATVAQVALRWIGRTLGFGTCLVGIKSQAQLEEAVGSTGLALTDGELARLDAAAEAPC